jgi:hypothetical protein
MRCLAKHPDQRYQCGQDLSDALLGYLHDAGTHTAERVRAVRPIVSSDEKTTSTPTQ